MTFKIVKPFVIELITFVFVIIAVFIALLAGNCIEIVFHAHLLTCGFIIVILVSLISLFSKIVTIGVKALVDFVFQNTKENVYVFLNEQPYRASIFSEKFGHDHARTLGMYYLLHFKNNDKIYTFISSSHMELFAGRSYTIKTGKTSNIFISANSVDA